jgi:hypothetical protein
MTYFVPTIPTYKLKHLIEREAQGFRAYLGLRPDEPVDSIEIADWLGIDVTYSDDLVRLSAATRQALVGEHSTQWSGLTCHFPNGIIVTILNPSHSPRRRQATLMEEVAHIHLHHAPSQIATDSMTGLMARTYDARTEMEAYWFGSATLAPKCGLLALYKQGFTPMEIADHYRVSPELITFRTNLCGL